MKIDGEKIESALDTWKMSAEDVDARIEELRVRYKDARESGRLPITASYLTNRLQHLHDYHPDGCMPWSATWLAVQVLAAMDEALEYHKQKDGDRG